MATERPPFSHIRSDGTPKDSLSLDAARERVAGLIDRLGVGFTWYRCWQAPEHYHVSRIRPRPAV